MPTPTPELLWDPSPRSRGLILDLPGLWVVADGGCIGSNPSPLGGTWAFRLLNGGVVEAEDSGHVPPKFGPVSNNISELYALCRGIDAASRRYSSCPLWVASDSGVTLRRICSERAKWGGVHERIREWAQSVLRESNLRGAVLLKGHPTQKMLFAGAHPDGLPVSAHNVWCDDACREWADRIRAQQTGQAVAA